MSPLVAGSPLVLGPVLRRVSGGAATIWVQTAGPATVEVRAGKGHGAARTFTAFDRHFALVLVEGLTPGEVQPYQVVIDGEPVWPPADYPYPAPAVHTRTPDAPVRLVFGSCREASQRTTDDIPPDALDAYAVRLAEQLRSGPAGTAWPDQLVLLGDQVYADETSPVTGSWLRRHRRRRVRLDDPPGDQVADFGEYCRLYLESWTDPEIRWLLSTVPSVMIFDDHEIIDDWNTSAQWRTDMRALPWWSRRITAGLASYWVFQHLGNLHPDDLATDRVYAAVQAAGDATGVLRDFGAAADTDRGSYRWSYRLDIGRTRIVVLDNRGGRVLTPGARRMLPDDDWAWFDALARGDGFDHLVVGSSLPWLLPPGVHHVEAAIERLAESPRRLVAAGAEKLRRGMDLEHWAAFGGSFEALSALLRQLATTEALASISVLSGDVHHSYVARPGWDPPVRVPVHQLTCSPVHNRIQAYLRPVFTAAWHRAGGALGRAISRAAGVPAGPMHWDKLAGPYFTNAIATLTHGGRTARVLIEGTDRAGRLHRLVDQQLT